MKRKVVLEKGEASCASQARLGGVGSLREGTSASSREGNGIGEPGRGTEWVAGWALGGDSKQGVHWGESGEQNGEMVDRGWSWVLFSQHKQQPQAQIAQHKRRFNDSFEYLGH